tara:strand:+ start:16310 stop:24628 length:8319 start_codon:yes stop_codon:yes gene_type:complete
MPANSPFQFRQIDDTFRRVNKAQPGLFDDVNDFSQSFNKATGTNMFDAGTGGFGNLMKGGSANIDRTIEGLGLDDAGAAFGGAVGGIFGHKETGAAAGSGLARGFVDFLPMIAAGVATAFSGGAAAPLMVAAGGIGATTSGVLAATNSYEKSDSLTQAAITGALTKYVPNIFGAGKQVALKGAARVGANVGTEVTEKGITQLAANGLGQKLTAYGGGQVAALAAFEAGAVTGEFLSGAEVHNPFTVENAIAQLVTQVPFAVLDLPYLAGRGTGAAEVKKTVENVERAEQGEIAMTSIPDGGSPDAALANELAIKELIQAHKEVVDNITADESLAPELKDKAKAEALRSYGKALAEMPTTLTEGLKQTVFGQEPKPLDTTDVIGAGDFDPLGGTATPTPVEAKVPVAPAEFQRRLAALEMRNPDHELFARIQKAQKGFDETVEVDPTTAVDLISQTEDMNVVRESLGIEPVHNEKYAKYIDAFLVDIPDITQATLAAHQSFKNLTTEAQLDARQSRQVELINIKARQLEVKARRDAGDESPGTAPRFTSEQADDFAQLRADAAYMTEVPETRAAEHAAGFREYQKYTAYAADGVIGEGKSPIRELSNVYANWVAKGNQSEAHLRGQLGKALEKARKGVPEQAFYREDGGFTKGPTQEYASAEHAAAAASILETSQGIHGTEYAAHVTAQGKHVVRAKFYRVERSFDNADLAVMHEAVNPTEVDAMSIVTVDMANDILIKGFGEMSDVYVERQYNDGTNAARLRARFNGMLKFTGAGDKGTGEFKKMQTELGPHKFDGRAGYDAFLKQEGTGKVHSELMEYMKEQFEDMEFMARNPVDIPGTLISEVGTVLKVGKQPFGNKKYIKETSLKKAFLKNGVTEGVWDYMKLRFPDLVNQNGLVSRETLLGIEGKDLVDVEVHEGQGSGSGLRTKQAALIHELDTAASGLDFGLTGEGPVELKVADDGTVTMVTVVEGVVKSRDLESDGSWSSGAGSRYREGQVSLGFAVADIIKGLEDNGRQLEFEMDMGLSGDFASIHGDVGPDPFVPYNAETGLGNVAFEITATGVKGGSSHTGNENTLAWVRGKFIDYQGKRVFRVDEVQSDAGQKFAKKETTVKEGEVIRVSSELVQFKHGKNQTVTVGVSSFGPDAQVRVRALAKLTAGDGHPLFPQWERIAIGTAFEQASKRGAEGVILPDSNTAMQTEGHDAHVRPIEFVTPDVGMINEIKQAVTGLRNDIAKEQATLDAGGYGEVSALKEQLAIVEGWQAKLKAGVETNLRDLDAYPNEGAFIFRLGKAATQGAKFTEGVEQPKQAPGMRAAYDRRLPNLAAKFSDAKGTPVDLGRHKNSPLQEIDQVQVKETETFTSESELVEAGRKRTAQGQKEGVDFELETFPHQAFFVLRPLKQVNAVIRTPVLTENGVPHTNVKGKLYPIPRQEAFGGTFPAGAKLVGHTGAAALARKLYAGTGTAPKEIDMLAAETLRVADVFGTLNNLDFGEVSHPELLGASATNVNTGRNAVFLNVAKLAKENKVMGRLVLAHEAGFHTLEKLYRQGKLDPRSQRVMDNIAETFDNINPKDGHEILRTAINELAPQYRKELLPILDNPQTFGTGSELRANVAAVMMLSLASPKTRGRMANFMTHMPKVFSDYMSLMAKYARKMTGVLHQMGRLGKAKLSPELSSELRHSLDGFTSQLKSLAKTEAQMAKDVDTLMRLQAMEPDGFAALQREAKNTPLHSNQPDPLLPPAYRDIDAFLKQEMDIDPTKPRGAVKGVGAVVNKIIAGAHQLAASFPPFADLLHLGSDHQSTVKVNQAKVFSAFATIPDGKGGRMVSKNLKHLKGIQSNAKTQQAFSDLARLRNVEGDSTFDKGSAEVQKILATVPEQYRDTMLDVFESIVPATNGEMHQVVLRTQAAAFTKMLSASIWSKNSTLTGEQAQALGESAWNAARLMGSPDPNMMLEGAKLQNELLMKMSPEALTPIMESANVLAEVSAKLRTGLAKNMGNISERRIGKHQITYQIKGVTKHGRVSGKTYHEANLKFLKEVKGRPFVKGTKDHTVQSRSKQQTIDSDMLDVILEAESKSKETIERLLSNSGPEGAAIYAALEPHLDTASTLQRNKQAESLVSLRPGREFREGRDSINMFENHLDFLAQVVHAQATGYMRSAKAFLEMDPAVKNNPEVLAQTRDILDAYMAPDSELGSKIAKTNFVFYMAGNISSHLMELGQSVFSLAPALSESGMGYLEGYALIGKSMKRAVVDAVTGGKGKTGDIEIDTMLADANRSGQTSNLGSMSDFYDADGVHTMNIRKMREGQAPLKMSDVITKPIGQFMDTSSRLYGMATHFNARTTLLSGFELRRKQILNGEKRALTTKEQADATQFAYRMNLRANFSGGKSARPSWFNKLPRTASQTLWSLQSYNMGMTATYGRVIRNGYGGDHGLTPTQRTSAKKAAVQLFGTQLLAAGALGLPFVGPMIALLEQMFPTLELNKELRTSAAGMIQDDESLGGIVADIALRGAAHSVPGAPDIGSRYAMSNIMGTSAYDGFSLEGFMGPTASLVNNIGRGIGQFSKGEISRGVESVLPTAFKRSIQLHRGEGTPRDQAGRPLVNDITMGEQAGMLLGFTPQRISRARDIARLQSRANEVGAIEYKRVIEKSRELQDNGDVDGARRVLEKHADENPLFSMKGGVRSVAKASENRQFAVDPRSLATSRSKDHNKLLASSQIGVDPQQLTRLLYRKRVESMLGMGQQGQLSQNELMKAARLDAILKENPFMSHIQGRQALGL